MPGNFVLSKSSNLRAGIKIKRIFLKNTRDYIFDAQIYQYTKL